jgi:hypothetical protein
MLAGFLLRLLLDLEDGGSTFIRNVGKVLAPHTALYPRRQRSSYITVVCLPIQLFYRALGDKTEDSTVEKPEGKRLLWET